MNRMEQLPDIANRQLSGLEATPTLLAKIKLEAAERREPRRMPLLRPIAAVCAALVVCLGAVTALNAPKPVALDSAEMDQVMDSYSAGTISAPTAQPLARSSVPQGSITMSSGSRRAAPDSLFAEGTQNGFPLVTLNGATYRMLQSPDGISSALLGAPLGAVSEFNVEPALGSGGIVSNVIPVGQTVYAVDAMPGALIAAEADGLMCLFQRVSYAGTAVIGAETLRDTLCPPDRVSWIEVDGLGRVDGAQAQTLMAILLDNADYQSTAMSGTASMQIGLTNGLVLQLLVGDDSVSACGTWSCPDFFESFPRE